jgi:hypothetical protein
MIAESGGGNRWESVMRISGEGRGLADEDFFAVDDVDSA